MSEISASADPAHGSAPLPMENVSILMPASAAAAAMSVTSLESAPSVKKYATRC